ncbi:hypothetical protein CBM2587_B90689 [Cupriavidus taiwanensis]|uniref:Uncharacterized protein n=1 Tax=Cupriavidus taiwanensis TaxID=164546 RepID=A0A976A8J7_9BURK|nr:hypothetical protein CBM2587_B90689 [Cupriavidus taiwanensis]
MRTTFAMVLSPGIWLVQNTLQLQETVEIAAPAGFALATDDFAFHAMRLYDRGCGRADRAPDRHLTARQRWLGNPDTCSRTDQLPRGFA